VERACPVTGTVRRWPLVLIAAPAAVAVWAGWVGLGTLCGFGIVHPLPGIASGFELNTAITLPVGVEAYGAYAMGAWLRPGTSPAARRFARRSALGALGLGMAGQVIYHLLAAAHATRAPWPVVMLVSCLPVLTLGFGGALTHLLRAGHDTAPADLAVPGDPAEPVPAGLAAPAPVPVLPAAPSPAARPRPARASTARKPHRAAVPDVDALMPLGWQVTADLAARGEPLTRDVLAAALRAAGHPAGNARVGALLTRLRTEAPAAPEDIPADIPALTGGGTR
jgi:hypothetical protein